MSGYILVVYSNKSEKKEVFYLFTICIFAYLAPNNYPLLRSNRTFRLDF